MTTYIELPIKFYVEKDGSALAVFPTEKATHNTDDIVCYSHVGQHSSCSLTYVKQLKRAKPDQYYPLLKELRNIYESPTYDGNIVILKIK